MINNKLKFFIDKLPRHTYRQNVKNRHKNLILKCYTIRFFNFKTRHKVTSIHKRAIYSTQLVLRRTQNTLSNIFFHAFHPYPICFSFIPLFAHCSVSVSDFTMGSPKQNLKRRKFLLNGQPVCFVQKEYGNKVRLNLYLNVMYNGDLWSIFIHVKMSYNAYTQLDKIQKKNRT